MAHSSENATFDDVAFKKFERRVSVHRLQRYRRGTESKAEAVALLRNRIFHHEPIYHWTLSENKKPSLLTRYERLKEVLGWLDIVQPEFLVPIDRFRKIHNAGWQALREETEFTFLTITEEPT